MQTARALLWQEHERARKAGVPLDPYGRIFMAGDDTGRLPDGRNLYEAVHPEEDQNFFLDHFAEDGSRALGAQAAHHREHVFVQKRQRADDPRIDQGELAQAWAMAYRAGFEYDERVLRNPTIDESSVLYSFIPKVRDGKIRELLEGYFLPQQRGEQLEVLTALCLSQALRNAPGEYFLVRTALHEDFHNATDLLIYEKNSDQILCGVDCFQQGSNLNDTRRQQKIERAQANNRSGGREIRYGMRASGGQICLARRKHVPTLIITAGEKEMLQAFQATMVDPYHRISDPTGMQQRQEMAHATFAEHLANGLRATYGERETRQLAPAMRENIGLFIDHLQTCTTANKKAHAA